MVSRVTGLNFRNIVPSSGVGNRAMRLFWQIFSNPQKSDPKMTEPLTTTQAETPPENREMALISVNSSDEKLLQMILFVQGDDGKLTFDGVNCQNHVILKKLTERIRQRFAQHAKEGEELVATALTPLFALAKGDPERFTIIVNLVIAFSNYCPRFTAAVLEKIEWPSETFKQMSLPAYLAHFIRSSFVSWQDDSIEINPCPNQESTFFYTDKLVIVTKNIFGHRDFIENPSALSPSLAQGIGIAIQKEAKAAMEDLKQKYSDQQTDENTNIGINLVIAQYQECRFPCSMLAPVLPYLKKIPGLVGLEIVDVGGSGQHAFRDEDAPALLEIFKTNPHLFHIKINVSAMTPETQKQFVEEWQVIMADRKMGAAIEDFFAIELQGVIKQES
jgi:hypothetical protein